MSNTSPLTSKGSFSGRKGETRESTWENQQLINQHILWSKTPTPQRDLTTVPISALLATERLELFPSSPGSPRTLASQCCLSYSCGCTTWPSWGDFRYNCSIGKPAPDAFRWAGALSAASVQTASPLHCSLPGRHRYHLPSCQSGPRPGLAIASKTLPPCTSILSVTSKTLSGLHHPQLCISPNTDFLRGISGIWNHSPCHRRASPSRR